MWLTCNLYQQIFHLLWHILAYNCRSANGVFPDAHKAYEEHQAGCWIDHDDVAFRNEICNLDKEEHPATYPIFFLFFPPFLCTCLCGLSVFVCIFRGADNTWIIENVTRAQLDVLAAFLPSKKVTFLCSENQLRHWRYSLMWFHANKPHWQQESILLSWFEFVFLHWSVWLARFFRYPSCSFLDFLTFSLLVGFFGGFLRWHTWIILLI